VNADEALEWLRARGAHPWLVRHHELVVEAGRELLAGLGALLPAEVDHERVLVGCALHDVGKMRHPEEMSVAGHAHEDAGRALLDAAGLGAVSRFAVTHARWNDASAGLEDRLVALADELWKGKRDEALERAVMDEIAAITERPAWDVFARFDETASTVAARGPERLARSAV
jgi:hypothetical protein